MSINDLIIMCERQLTRLSQLRASAEALGDLQQVAAIDTQDAETRATLNLLRTP
jgi:hypothetical protein